MKCIECQHWGRLPTDDPKTKTFQERMAALGFSNCAIRSISKGHTFSANSSCEKFDQAEEGVGQKRLAFINRSQDAKTSG